MPSLISIDASLAMKDRHVLLVVAVTELLLAAFADKYYCCQSTCDASFQGGATQTPAKRGTPAPEGARFWTGLQRRHVSLWRLCMLPQLFVDKLLSKLSAVRSKGITFQPLISQVFLMGMYPDIFINVSSS